MLVSASVVLGLTLFRVPSYSVSKLAALCTGVFLSMIICRYQSKIPFTEIIFSARTLFVFLGVVWLGVGGALILSVTGSIAHSVSAKNEQKPHWFEASADIAATFISAFVFYSLLGIYPNFQENISAVELYETNILIAAICVMAFSHYTIHSLVTYLFLRFESSQPIGALVERQFGRPFVTYAINTIFAISLCLIFIHFGIEFGFVLVPIVVAGSVAHKIHVRRLEQKTRQISDASRIHLATVEALATAIDARDQVGIGHVRRTQIYAMGIGELLLLSEKEIQALRTGSLLHDIGKLAVPDHILNKPGRLTPAELEKTKIHSSVGASILEKIGFDYPVVPTVKYHHENWDGSGYPEGLRGENIPLTARILSVADAYDTLRGARPYRPAVAPEEAKELLRMGAGSKFDPRIVNTFLRNLEILNRIIEKEGFGYAAGLDGSGRREREAQIDASPSYVLEIKKANHEVFTLYSLAKEFSASMELDETLSLFTEKIREFVPFDTCLVYLMDECGKFAEAKHADGKNGEALKGNRIDVGEGATGYVLQMSKSVENVDPALDFGFSHPDFSRDYTAMASIPLINDEKLIGALSLYSSVLACYDDEHLRLLDTVSHIASDAIIRALQLAEAESYALTDPMTGLPNSRSLQNHFEKERKRASRSGGTFQLLVLDLDGFKAVNDTFGHKAGDTMLREVGQAIHGQLRDYDFLARYGGDEFVAIIPDTETADVLDLSRRIEKAVCDFKMQIDERVYASVGVSIGSASFPNHGETFDQMIVAADKAMYLTKEIHRQRTRSPFADVFTSLEIPRAQLLVETAESSSKPSRDETEDSVLLELDENDVISSSAIN